MRSCAPEDRVFDTDQKLRHLSFFEEVAVLEADSAQWRAATAGLVTLRLVDSWLDGDLSLKEDHWSVPRVRSAILEIEETTTQRTMLLRVVDALRTKKPDVRAVISPLMAYGQALEYDGQWLLAGDVYQTLLAHLHPIEDGDATIASHLRLAGCFRKLNKMDEALAAFSEAAAIGSATGDMVGVLRGRLGEAQVAFIRGNLPSAESILDDTIARATGADLQDVRMRALTDRSGVAILRGQYELAVRLAYKALRDSEHSTERDKILLNIAGAFANLGVYSAARDAYMVLSATAQDQFTRWAATLNLLEVAGMTGMETMFEQYRRQLADVSLPPQLAAAYPLMIGQGYHRLGDANKARPYLEKAVTLATDLGFSQYLFEAEQSLSELERPVPTNNKVEPVVLDLEEVVDAIRGLREAAAIS
jgi:tetratricopeptide (TPR) repeat protein